jgi:integrase
MTGMIDPERREARDGTVSYRVRFRTGGKQTSQTFVSRRDARRFAKWIEVYGASDALALLDETQGATDQEYTVAEWCSEHVDRLTGVTAGSIGRYRSYIRNDLGRLGELPMTAVSARHIERWVQAMERSGAAGKTIRNKHGFLFGALDRAAKESHIPANPCKGTRLPTSVQPPMVFLSHDEYARLLGCFIPYWQPLVEVLFGTGLRWGEITALRIGDVDLDAATVSVTRAWKDAPGGRVIGPPKSRMSRRTIALAPATVTVLRSRCDGRAGDAYVFVNQRGGPVRGQTFHDNVWQPAVRLANGEAAQRDGGKRVARRRDASGGLLAPLTPPLGKRPRVHDARHTCASWLLGAGIPLNVVQAHLGHESITTTVGTYGHLLPSSLGQVRDALTLALSQSAPELLP